MDPRITALFVPKNLVFITKDDGRKPTLYFDDGNGNKGRIRQEHPKGPKLSFQPKEVSAQRVFLTDHEMDALKKAGRKSFDGTQIISHATSTPTEGYRVFEYSVLADNAHPSGGSVLLLDEDDSFDFNINDYKDVVSIWEIKK